MTTDPAAALDKVFELAGRIGDLMQSDLAEHGLTPARAEVLLVLHHRRESLVQRQLSEVLRCTPRHVTSLVDTLEAHGWAVRTPHPSDRRATLVGLTSRGTAEAERLDTERRAAAHALLGKLPARDVAGFVRVADHVLDQLTPQDPPS